ncbi:MAG TPA: hypothetical protein VEQ85_02465, partial [Lacipirellulaceae bacterium]|nr:hypothetical protein [Lacipirellulaceae bacterium]
ADNPCDRSGTPMKLVLLSTDLMTMSAAQGAADRHGWPLKVVATSATAVAECSGSPGVLLAVDLRATGLDVASLVAELRAAQGAGPPTHVLAFGPHVHADSLAAAAAAGCDEVVTRGEFERRLNAALSRAST